MLDVLGILLYDNIYWTIYARKKEKKTRGNTHVFLQKATENFLERANKQRVTKEKKATKRKHAQKHGEASEINSIHDEEGKLGKLYPQRTYLKKKGLKWG